MSKFLKAMLVSVYTVLFYQYLRTTLLVGKGSIELEYVFRQPGYLKKMLKDLKRNGGNLTLRKLMLDFEEPERLPTDFKYILKWTKAFSHYTSSIFPNGQSTFIENQCTYMNCFLTNDKSLLVDIRYYDAILFDVENTWDYQPFLRSPHQRYIFTASESASNYPVCHPTYDSFYNLTWTYKLDSDIRWSFITILTRGGVPVGPQFHMTWIDPMKPTPDSVTSRLTRKKKAAAWFVSNCMSQSKRETLGAELSKELAKYQLSIDIYGWCGHLTCSRDNIEECLDLLEQDYYFYLAFENSLSDDYVTEKVMYALKHYTVPIVYGGADYSRFLPPGSYINALELNVSEIAFRIDEAMKNFSIYRDYFRWHNYYFYQESPKEPDVCKLCEILNNPAKEHSVVKNFRYWWNPDYEKRCEDDLKQRSTKLI